MKSDYELVCVIFGFFLLLLSFRIFLKFGHRFAAWHGKNISRFHGNIFRYVIFQIDIHLGFDVLEPWEYIFMCIFVLGPMITLISVHYFLSCFYHSLRTVIFLNQVIDVFLLAIISMACYTACIFLPGHFLMLYRLLRTTECRIILVLVCILTCSFMGFRFFEHYVAGAVLSYFSRGEVEPLKVYSDKVSQLCSVTTYTSNRG